MSQYTKNSLGSSFFAVFDETSQYDVFVSEVEKTADSVMFELNAGIDLQDVLAKYDTEGFPEAARLVSTGEAVLPD